MSEIKELGGAGAPDQNGMRRRSVGSIELQTSDGRKRSVALADLTDADRELAEKFGYKPVCKLAVLHARIADIT